MDSMLLLSSCVYRQLVWQIAMLMCVCFSVYSTSKIWIFDFWMFVCLFNRVYLCEVVRSIFVDDIFFCYLYIIHFNKHSICNMRKRTHTYKLNQNHVYTNCKQELTCMHAWTGAQKTTTINAMQYEIYTALLFAEVNS